MRNSLRDLAEVLKSQTPRLSESIRLQSLLKIMILPKRDIRTFIKKLIKISELKRELQNSQRL
jgi:hypothetical protein